MPNRDGRKPVLRPVGGVIAACVCLYGATASHARAAADPIQVGIYENAPKIHLDDKDRPAGLFVELLQAIARDEGWELDFVPCTWPQCLEDLSAGEIDLLPDVALSPDRDRRFAFHDIPVARSSSVILAPQDSSIRTFADLAGRRVALLAGSVQVSELKQLMSNYGHRYTSVTYPSLAEAFDSVRNGRTDAVATNRFHAGAFAGQYGLRKTTMVFAPVALFFAAPEGDPRNLLPAVDRHLRAWRFDDDSIYYQAMNNAMIPAQEAVVPPRMQYLLAGALALVLLALAVTAVFRRQVKRKTAQLGATAQRLDHLLRASPAVLYHLTLDADAQVQTRWISDNAQRLFNFDPDEFVRLDRWRRQLHPEDRETVLENLAVLPHRQRLVQEYRLRDGDGKVRFVRDEMRFLPGPAGQADEIFGAWSDITESHEQAARLSFLTHYDALTGLPNRVLFGERLEHAVYRARREGRALAVLHMGIDRFKTINESFGYGAGDSALKAAADRILHTIDAGDTLARIGGDGFVLLLTGETTRQRATGVARSIMKRFVEPIEFDGHELQLTLSVGISMFPSDADDAEPLLRHAEAALFDAKHSGRNAYRLYSSSLAAGQAERLSLERSLRGAIGRGEMVLFYQPQLELETRRLVGAEALIRWQHPELGLVSPNRFIPLAEEIGTIGELGAWVIAEACRQLREWLDQGWDMPGLSVNLSVQQIDAESLVPLLSAHLDEAQLHPSRLELEVTESMIMREPARAADTLRKIREMGIKVAIDDFGTGYSSLNYLKHLSIDRLKIDRSFVRDLSTDANSRAISRAVIGLARSLELEVVAEGIEDEPQLAFLRREGCQLGQGYLFSPPIPGERFLREWSARAPN